MLLSGLISTSACFPSSQSGHSNNCMVFSCRIGRYVVMYNWVPTSKLSVAEWQISHTMYFGFIFFGFCLPVLCIIVCTLVLGLGDRHTCESISNHFHCLIIFFSCFKLPVANTAHSPQSSSNLHMSWPCNWPSGASSKCCACPCHHLCLSGPTAYFFLCCNSWWYSRPIWPLPAPS